MAVRLAKTRVQTAWAGQKQCWSVTNLLDDELIYSGLLFAIAIVEFYSRTITHFISDCCFYSKILKTALFARNRPLLLEPIGMTGEVCTGCNTTSRFNLLRHELTQQLLVAHGTDRLAFRHQKLPTQTCRSAPTASDRVDATNDMEVWRVHPRCRTPVPRNSLDAGKWWHCDGYVCRWRFALWRKVLSRQNMYVLFGTDTQNFGFNNFLKIFFIC